MLGGSDSHIEFIESNCGRRLGCEVESALSPLTATIHSPCALVLDKESNVHVVDIIHSFHMNQFVTVR